MENKEGRKGILSNRKAYIIDLTNVEKDELRFDYSLDNAFFTELDQTEITEGKVDVSLLVKKVSSSFEFIFNLKGYVIVPCDRCLAELKFPIETGRELLVKFGDQAEDVDDDLIIVSDEERKLDVAWLLYEFILLSLPIMRVHEEGQCDPAMLSYIAEHDASLAEEEEDLDPRWNDLKKILDNN